MKFVTTLAISLLIAFSVGMATGCKEEGPAEKAGKAFDDAIDDLEDKADEAKDKLE